MERSRPECPAMHRTVHGSAMNHEKPLPWLLIAACQNGRHFAQAVLLDKKVSEPDVQPAKSPSGGIIEAGMGELNRARPVKKLTANSQAALSDWEDKKLKAKGACAP